MTIFKPHPKAFQSLVRLYHTLKDRFSAFLKRKISASTLLIGTALFLVAFENTVFYQQVMNVYPLSPENILFLCSLVVLVFCVILFCLALFCIKPLFKPFLIFILITSSLVSYFMGSYGTIMDSTMIQNTFQTDMKESLDLLTPKLVLFLLFLGILPSLIVYRLEIKPISLKRAFISRLKLISGSLVLILIMLLSFGKFYTSFFREHKTLRYYCNPIFPLYSLVKYSLQEAGSGNLVVKPIGTDARIPDSDLDRELIILVIGETARADRFSLNGYHRETNPLLQSESVISFTNMFACGTSTAVSVPCMFSIYGREDFSNKKAKTTQNLLDVVTYAGVNILWRDNNSSSKGVATNVQYEDYRLPENNTICDEECRDEGMLIGLQDYIDQHESGDILIILHQMGNHGPAYYKRYPDRFEVFTPTCKTNMLQDCTKDEIGNTYDNAILYTDYFLSKTIALLKDNNEEFEPALIYFSDHGESLGENGMYLHGLPYFMAPVEQKQVAALMWFGESFKIDTEGLQEKADEAFSHDNLFHTILGLMEIESSIYDQSLDIINYDN